MIKLGYAALRQDLSNYRGYGEPELNNRIRNVSTMLA